MLLGAARLTVGSVGSVAVFPDPGNILVRLTSDLTVQVQCMAENGTGTDVFTWSQSGTVVPSGLQAFGVSQGGNGILRVYPAQQLLGGRNQFVCSTDTECQLYTW